MEEHYVHAGEAHALEASVEAGGEEIVGAVGRRVPQPAFRRHAHAVGQRAAERLANHRLRLAVPVGGREVEQCYAGVRRLADDGHALLAGGLAPNLTESASAERESAHGAEFAERPLFHTESPLAA